MKLGVLLPTFRDNADDALALADEAQAKGLDGVFAFDHLWPMGSPQRPSLAPFPVLAAIATRCPSLVVGPLVARVGLATTSKLVEQFATLEGLAPGRIIAALGTGDRLSAAEQVAYDLGYPDANERRQLLGDALEALAPRMEVWCGAGSQLTNDLARRHGVTINLWGVAREKVSEMALGGRVTWAGPLGENAAAALEGLERAGSAWAVAATPFNIDELVEWRNAR